MWLLGIRQRFGPRDDNHPMINRTVIPAGLIVSSITHDARIGYSPTKMRGLVYSASIAISFPSEYPQFKA